MAEQREHCRLRDLVEYFHKHDADGFRAAYDTPVFLGLGKVEDAFEEEHFGEHTMSVDVFFERERSEDFHLSSLPVIKSGNTDTVWFVPKDRPVLRLGRHRSSDIVIAEQSISVDHCRILCSQTGRVAIADSGASNSVWVGDRRLNPKERVTLQADDLVLLGRFMFRFFYAHELLNHVAARADQVRPSTSTKRSAPAQKRNLLRRLLG